MIMYELEFGKFLSSSIRSADRRLANRGGIAKKYGIRPVGVDMVCSTLSGGWDAFVELANRINSGYIPWATSIGAVLGATAVFPSAIIGAAIGKVGNSLSFWGGDEKAVRSMYDHKNLIIAVHKLGRSKLSEFSKCQNDESKIQDLKNEIVEEIVNNQL